VGRVIIGVDPHKLSATIEVLDQRENVLGGGRFGTDRDGYRQMLTVGRRWPQRVWAVEGCNEGCRSGSPRRAAANPRVVDRIRQTLRGGLMTVVNCSARGMCIRL